MVNERDGLGAGCMPILSLKFKIWKEDLSSSEGKMFLYLLQLNGGGLSSISCEDLRR